jgi:outer membrane murein-binding lipoprotein Lpp
MKRLVFLFSAAALSGGMLLTSCNSNETAGENLDRISNNVDEKADNFTEWMEYRKAAKAEITANRQKIAELRVKQDKSGELGDKIRQEQIDRLQAENDRLQQKLNSYDPKREADGKRWDEFKREFRHDMDELGSSIRDIGRDNEK